MMNQAEGKGGDSVVGYRFLVSCNWELGTGNEEL
jgi:hypothetical protein